MATPQIRPRMLAVDIATTGVRALVAEADVGGPNTLGHGVAPRYAVRAGRVIEPDMLEAAIRDAVRAAGTDPTDTPAWVGMPALDPNADETSIRRSAAAITRCCHHAGLRIHGTMPAAAASGLAVTSADERQRGVAVVDLGAGPARFAVFVAGAHIDVGSIRQRGAKVIGDVALGLRTTVTAARRIVVEDGCAMPDRVPAGELVDVPSLGGRPDRAINRWFLSELVHDSLSQILLSLRRRLAEPDIRSTFASGIVITGGFGRLPAIADLAEELFDVPVRVGTPMLEGRDDLGPEHATLVGVALHAASGAPVMN